MSTDALDRLSSALADRYSIERELGRGGMATVYLAHDKKHERPVALKVLKPELAAALGPERFLAEIKLTASLQHPHILPLHDSGQGDGLLYYVMPFAEGESLRDRLDRERQLPIDEAIAMARGVAAALDYAHRHDVIHRDVKPENILLVDGEAVVADFGIALAVDAAGSDRLTEQGVSLGTPMYMSPEQATGEPVDGRADIYSLASVLYEMLAGQPPYTDSTLNAFVARLLTEQPVRPKLLRDTIPGALDDEIMKALSKAAADRHQTADGFAHAIERAVTAPTPTSRGRLGVAVAAAAAVVALGLTAYNALRPPGGGVAPVREERQLTFEGIVREASMSPDGTHFAYVTGDGDFSRLFVREIEAASAILLDSLPELICCPTWSPDGTRIAYQRGTRGSGTTVITPRLGGPRRPVRAEVALAWSPDASELLSWWPAAKELTLSDVATASIVDSIPLGTLHIWVNGADWSPDGEHIVVALQDSVAYRVRSLDRAGRLVEELVTDTVPATSPRWSRDGSTIYYLRGGAVWSVPVTASGRRSDDPRLALAGVDANVMSTTVAAIAVSDDGSRLLYNRFTGHSNLWRFSGWDGVGGEPAQRQPLTRGTADRGTPRISPDGAWVAYMEGVDERRELFVMPVEGGAPRQLTFFGERVWSPSWSPDGETIAFGATQDGVSGLWLLDHEGGRVSKAGLASFEGDELLWTPHGIVYQSLEHTRIVIVDPEDWSERVLVDARPGAWYYDLRLSPDGAALLVRRTGDENGLWRFDLASGEGTSVAESARAAVGHGAGGEVLAMSIDGRRDLRREIYRVAPDGGAPALYLSLPLGQAVNSSHVSIAPDGRFFIAAVPVSSSDVWLVDNFDPR